MGILKLLSWPVSACVTQMDKWLCQGTPDCERR